MYCSIDTIIHSQIKYIFVVSFSVKVEYGPNLSLLLSQNICVTHNAPPQATNEVLLTNQLYLCCWARQSVRFVVFKTLRGYLVSFHFDRH